MSRRLLYRRSGLGVMVIVAMGLAAVPCSMGQGRPQLKRPEQAPQEKPPEPKKKPVKGPRAVGILQISGGKTTLIPVAILVEGRFYDASVYKADPVPMALDGGTVYEVERSGESEGLFTINGALHSKNAGVASPWLGTGSYLANGTEAPKSTRIAEDVPLGIEDSGDEPPRLTRGNAAKAAAPSAGSPPAGTETAGKAGSSPVAGPGQASGSSSEGASGKETAKEASAPAGTTPNAAEAPSSSAEKNSGQGNGAQAPAGQKTSGQSSAEKNSSTQNSEGQGSTGDGKSGASDGGSGQTAENYYRPTLRRGKPTQAAPAEEEAPTAANKGAAPASVDGKTATAAPVQVEAAISDAGGPEARSYKFFWKEGEEDERRKQMLALAADEVRAYVSARAKGAIPAKPVTAKSGSTPRKVTAKPVQPDFENIQFHAFDVWTKNQPVMILNAEASLPGGSSTTPTVGTYSITLVARTDIYGNLRKLYSGVTDKFHLDVTPRLELIDVVDADGDGRGELLFRETTDAGSGYVIYRATADTLWKMFDSLGG